MITIIITEYFLYGKQCIFVFYGYYHIVIARKTLYISYYYYIHITDEWPKGQRWQMISSKPHSRRVA